MFGPCTAGELLKWKMIVVFPFNKTDELAGVPFTVKSLASTVPGSAPPLRLIVNSVGGVPTIMLPQAVLVTEQPMGVGVGVSVPAPGGSLSKKVSPWETSLIVTRSSTHPTRCWLSTEEA